MAYAAVISLKHTFERLINPTNPQDIKSDELKKLFDDILKILDTSRRRSKRWAINAFDAQIREAASDLEDEFEYYGLGRSLHPYVALREEGCPHILSMEEVVKQKSCSFLEHVRLLNDQLPDEEEEEDDVVSPSHNFGEYKSTMVGLSDQFKKIIEELLDPTLDLKIVSLFGMAGIGKSRLVKNVYDDPSTIKPFHVRVWVTVGPKHRKENLIEHVAGQIEGALGDKYIKYDSIGLGEHIYKNLCGRRYFIVLDDIWSTQALNDLKVWLPKEKFGSRLLLTTRLEEVAKYATESHIGQRLLNPEESWNLFWPIVFSDETFPDELEETGRKIAKNCEGLPLLILEVANILGKMEKTTDCWNRVADKKGSSTFPDAYDRISEVLSSSYEYLPQYLKACFLYMGAFPQNYEIPLHKLINLWSVEDFLEPNPSKTLQDFAMECLEKLVTQSLVFVRKDSSNNRIKSCKLHSTYWHLCVILARKDKFLHVLNFLDDASIKNMESNRRLSVQNNVLFGIKEVRDSMAVTRTRSLLCTGQYLQYPVQICLNSIQLKVLDALAIRFYELPSEVLKSLQLKYLAVTHDGNLPLSITKLQKLQSLIVRQHHNIKYGRDSTSFPKEIWDMQELKYLRIIGSILPDPSSGAMLPNLLTLHVDARSCTEDVFRSIPKLKKLGIKIELRPRSNEILNCFEHISILKELESLKCIVVNPRLRYQVVAPPNPHSSFPRGLLKLSLNGIGYSWKYMSAIGSLPNLQVLKLRHYAFRGPEWKTEVGFPALKFLLLEDLDLEQWIVDDDNCFPILERLIIRYCFKLEGIPSKFEDIMTLNTIQIDDCMPSLRDRARQIEEDVNEFSGSDSLQVPISLSWEL